MQIILDGKDKELESALIFPVNNGLLQFSFCYIGGGQRGLRKFPFNRGVWACIPDNLQHIDFRNVISNILGMK